MLKRFLQSLAHMGPFAPIRLQITGLSEVIIARAAVLSQSPARLPEYTFEPPFYSEPGPDLVLARWPGKSGWPPTGFFLMMRGDDAKPIQEDSHV